MIVALRMQHGPENPKQTVKPEIPIQPSAEASRQRKATDLCQFSAVVGWIGGSSSNDRPKL